jgi:hypothetical protein
MYHGVRNFVGQASLGAARSLRSGRKSYGERAISRFDAVLQRAQGVYEFSQRADCILRVAPGRARRAMVLEDGTALAVGDPVLQLHLWNEHIARIPRGGAGLAWAREFRRQFRVSFAALAHHVAHDSRCRELRAVWGRCAFIPGEERAQLAHLARPFGLELLDEPEPDRLQAFHDFWENVYIIGLILCFNPAAALDDVLRRNRYQLWISRDRLIALHAPRAD